MCVSLLKSGNAKCVCVVTALSFVQVQPGQIRIDRPLMPSAANKWIIENPVVTPPVLCLRWDTAIWALQWHSHRLILCFSMRQSDRKMNLFSHFHSVSHALYIFIFVFYNVVTVMLLFFMMSVCVFASTEQAGLFLLDPSSRTLTNRLICREGSAERRNW